MRLYRKWILPVLLLTALLAAGCAASSSSETLVPTQPATAQAIPSATAFEALPATEAAPTLEVPATGAEVTPPAATAPAAEGFRFEIVPDQSEARYRVREQLANVSLPNDAIGKTNSVTGAIVIAPDGTIDAAQSRFEVDVSTLQSDQSRRDNFLKRSTLQTDQYPTVVFIPKAITGLTWPLPETGDFSFQMTGDLTIRDVTKEVTWDVTGNLQGDQAVGQATTRFTFADFNLEQPRVPMVLSIVDEINLELDATMQRVSGGTASSAVVPDAQDLPTPTDPALALEEEMPHSGAGTPAAAPVCSAPAPLTPAMTEGPYYTPNAPERTSLIEPGIPGQKLTLTGVVLTTNCEPVAGALLDFWQTDGDGNYDNSGFRLRGRQYTDDAGRYTLETVVPGLYPGRTAHIHVKVQAPGGPVVTSQLFFPGEAQNQTDRIFDSALLVDMQPASDGYAGTYNFVVSSQ